MLLRLKQAIEKNPGDWFAISFLGGWPLIYFWQAALRQAVFYFGDIYLFFYPTRYAFVNALREGRLPLWSPEMMSGFPLFAEGQVAALYPLNLLLYSFLPIDLANNYVILLHLAWVAVGMYLFLRALKLQPASAFLGAFAFASGGFFYARLVHMTILATAAWMPWLFWAWERFEQETDRARRWRWFAVLCVFSAIQLLGGHPQFALFSAVMLGLYSLVRWKRGDDSRKRNLISEFFDPARAIPIILFFLIGALIAGAQIVPTYELTTVSNRATGLLPKFFNAYSLRLPHYLMLLHPFLLGNPYPLISVETIGYIGFLPILFALAAPFLQRDRRVFFFLLIALMSLFLAMGDQNALYRGMRYLPILNFFRVPARFFFLFSFSAAILAATTCDYFLRRAQTAACPLAPLEVLREEPPLRTRGQRTLLAVFVVLIALIVGLAPWVPLQALLAVWTWLPLALFCLSGWIMLGARRGLFARNTLILLALGLTIADLALFAAVYSKTYNATTTVADFYAPPKSLTALKDISVQEGRVLADPWIEPWLAVERESLFPNLPILYGIAGARGYTPLLLQHNDDLIEDMNAAILNLMNVKYLLKPQMLPVDAVTEGNDLQNEFGLDLAGYGVSIPPTAVTKIRVTSSMAQSVAFPTGYTVANVNLILDDGTRRALPLRAGLETAEWAYERSDVRAVTKHALPPIATTFPASSAFPVEKHAGHTYLGEYDVAREGKPIIVTGVTIAPTIERGLLYVERVEFGLADGKIISLAHLLGKSDQQLVYRTNDVAIFENADRLPRAFIVHLARVAKDDAALGQMTRNDFDPRTTLYLADGDPLAKGGAQKPDEAAQIVEYKSEWVALSVRASEDGYLVLTDSWYPGWVARVDGVETPIHRADLAFRAVRVNVGEHRVEFEYRPVSLYVGAGMSVVGLLIVWWIWRSARS